MGRKQLAHSIKKIWQMVEVANFVEPVAQIDDCIEWTTCEGIKVRCLCIAIATLTHDCDAVG